MKPTEPKPFYSHEAECGVIGSILLGGDCDEIDAAIPYGSGAFFDSRCRCLVENIGFMRGDGKHVDCITLVEELKQLGKLNEAGGIEFVAGLADLSPSPSSGTYYAKIVSEKYALRQMYNLVVTLKNKLGSAGEQAIEDVVDQFERGASEIRGLLTRPTGDVDNKEVLRGLVDLYQSASKGTRPYYVPTGFPDLDRISGGMRPGELFVIGALTGVGKTTLSLNIAANCSDKGFGVGIVSMEMNGQELLGRLIAAEARVSTRASEEGVLSQDDQVRMAKAVGHVNKLPIHICDRGTMRIEDIVVKITEWVKKKGIRLAIIDHMLLVSIVGKSLREELSVVTRRCKSMAMDLQIPIILVTQLNRESEKEKRIPRLSDLKETGSTEADANVVWFLFRDEDPKSSIVKLLQAKHRRCQMDTVEFLFNRRCNRFESVERMVSE